jgi:ligand-binding SRPBCC domain-containing protein
VLIAGVFHPALFGDEEGCICVMGQFPGWISTHSLAENDDDTQMYDNLLKFYVYSVKYKAPFSASQRVVLS